MLWPMRSNQVFARMTPEQSQRFLAEMKQEAPEVAQLALGAAAFGTQDPFTPVRLLWLNLISDPLPALRWPTSRPAATCSTGPRRDRTLPWSRAPPRGRRCETVSGWRGSAPSVS